MLLSSDASKPTRNGFVHLLRETQKQTEGTEHGSLERVKGAKSNYFRRNQMAQVTYRGVVYDTDRNKAKQTNKVDLTYRGVRLEKELTSVK